MALISQSINTGYSIAHYLSSQFKTCVFPSASFILNAYSFGEQGWRSGESTRLPPMWTGFKPRRRHHMWVEFVVGSLPCSERFFSEYSGFPLSSKTNIPKFQFDQESGRRRTTMWMYYLQIVIYLFIYRLFIYAAANIQQNINLILIFQSIFVPLPLHFLQPDEAKCRLYCLHGGECHPVVYLGL